MDPDNNLYYIGKLLLLILAQVFVINQLHIAGYITSMIYLIFVYEYPTTQNRSVLLSLGFFVGLILDILTDSLAFNTIALLIVTYVRPYLLGFIFGIAVEQKSFKFKDITLFQKLSYLGLLVVIHHSVYFIAEGMSISNALLITKKIVTTSLVSFMLLLLLLSLFSKQKK